MLSEIPVAELRRWVCGSWVAESRRGLAGVDGPLVGYGLTFNEPHARELRFFALTEKRHELIASRAGKLWMVKDIWGLGDLMNKDKINHDEFDVDSQIFQSAKPFEGYSEGVQNAD